MSPFRNIVLLALGDFPAKALHFLAFVYLARVLGVANYGVLEFAVSIVLYFQLLADAGLEIWATRQATQTTDIQQLARRVVPLRMLLSVGAFGALMTLLPVLPDHPRLPHLLLFFGLTLFAQGISLKWVFMGREQMTRVAQGLVLAQVVFTAAVFACVRGPTEMLWVPVLRVAGDFAMTAYFWRLFTTQYGHLQLSFTLRGASVILKPALTMGGALILGTMNYNFDSVLLGLLIGPLAVGWYNAAYKPVTVALAMPVTYFLGLFPALSRTYAENQEAFRDVVGRSLRLTSIFAIPLGVGGTILAEPIIYLLFGADYANAVPPLRILSWAAALAILRGTYKHGLNAAGKQHLDLRCASLATALNVSLNLVLIPSYGIVGAAIATALAEVFWFVMTCHYFNRYVYSMSLLPFLLRPVAAAIAMGTCFGLAQSLIWPVQAGIGVLVYFAVLLLLGEAEVRSWVLIRKAPVA